MNTALAYVRLSLSPDHTIEWSGELLSKWNNGLKVMISAYESLISVDYSNDTPYTKSSVIIV